MENSLIRYEYNLIVLPCPGSSSLVIKTRRVTFNVLHVYMGRFKKKTNFLAKVHRANEKNISVIFMELIKKINNNNNNHSLTTSLQLPVKHNQMEQRKWEWQLLWVVGKAGEQPCTCVHKFISCKWMNIITDKIW